MRLCFLAVTGLIGISSCSGHGDGEWTPGEAGGTTSNPRQTGGTGGTTADAGGSGGRVSSGGSRASGGSVGRGGSSSTGGGPASGGSFSSGGSIASGGSAGAISIANDPKLGAACVSDSTCGSNLTCVKPTDTLLGGGPAHGMCSTRCTDNTTCQAIHADSYCVLGTAGSVGYCFEGCAYGEPADGTQKCHGRFDFACSPIGATAEDSVPICQPACSGDLDCPAGLFCNTGLCTTTAPTGKDLGTPCDPNATVPECKGLCVPDVKDGPGTCTDVCALGVPCARNSDIAGGACLLGISLIESPFAGDLGLCAQTCNASAECANTALKCVAFSSPEAEQAYGKKGMCSIPTAADTVL